jgi:hypothetical protein
MLVPKNVLKYLAKSDSENWKIELAENKLFNNIIVVPAINESQNIPKLLNSLAQNSKKYLNETLVLIVVNNSEKSEKKIIEDNFTLIKFLRNEQIEKKYKINIGIIDASTENKSLSEKFAGVGFARKIGMDLALDHFNYSNENNNILISLDADCLVDKNYLEEIVNSFRKKNLNSAVVKFEHVLPENEEPQKAIINYEIFLRYYVLGLKFAKSHFDYLSVGSTIVCDAESYVKVGGMNKKKAGEDFYFLEKLAKLNKIEKINTTRVLPSARISERVPFGTGIRIKRFLNNEQDEYKLYSPKIFYILKKFLELFNNIDLNEKSVHEVLFKSKEIHKGIFEFLIKQNFESDWKNILESSKSKMQLEKQKINWMDNFKTLKLIHYLRDKYFPNENMFEAVNDLLDEIKITREFRAEKKIPPINIQQKYLNLLRELT